MSESLSLIDAALFQLKAAAVPEMQLTVNLLSNAVEGARQGVSAAAVNDIEFALSDVAASVRDLSSADAERIEPIVTMLQEDVARLKEATALSPAVTGAIRAFQTKLKARRAAIEKQTYRPEGSPAEELPHPPQELQREAVPLRQQLTAAGFSTPALDTLIADPTSLRFHSINEILNELDVIVG